MWFPYKPPAEFQLAGATITICGCPAMARSWGGKPPKNGLVSSAAPAPPPRLVLCRWGRDRTSIWGECGVGGTVSDCLLWLCLPGCAGWAPLTFKKGQFLFVWPAASEQVWMGVGEQTLDKEPPAWWWPLYRCAVFNNWGFKTIAVCLESLLIQCFPSIFKGCFSSSLGLLFCPGY